MKFGINDHIDGDTRLDPRTGPDVVGGVRNAAAWSDRRLERIRGRLDHPRRVLVRDFIVFELKLFLDWLKGPIIAQVAVVAFILDLIRPGGRSFGFFYKVLRMGERLDAWLSLYEPSRGAEADPEGLFGASRAGSPTLLGQLEGIVHRVVVGSEGEWESGLAGPAGAPGVGGQAQSEAPRTPPSAAGGPVPSSSFQMGGAPGQ